MMNCSRGVECVNEKKELDEGDFYPNNRVCKECKRKYQRDYNRLNWKLTRKRDDDFYINKVTFLNRIHGMRALYRWARDGEVDVVEFIELCERIVR